VGDDVATMLLTAHLFFVSATIAMLARRPGVPKDQWVPIAAAAAAIVGVLAYVALSKRVGAVALTWSVNAVLVIGLVVGTTSSELGPYARYFALVALGPISLLNGSAIALGLWSTGTGLRLLPIVLAGSHVGSLLAWWLTRALRAPADAHWLPWSGVALLSLGMLVVVPLRSADRRVQLADEAPSRPALGYATLMAVLAFMTYALSALAERRYEVARVEGALPVQWGEWLLVYFVALIVVQVVIVPRLLQGARVAWATAIAALFVTVAQALHALRVMPSAAIPYLDVAETAVRSTVIHTVLVIAFLPLSRRQKYLSMAIVWGLAQRLGELAGGMCVAFGGPIRWAHTAVASAWLIVAVAAGASFLRRGGRPRLVAEEAT
jgi:hypothetical protein